MTDADGDAGGAGGQPHGQPRRADRRQRQARGRSSELLASLLLIAKGYRILARRYRTPVGEIDIVARRGRRLAFVEVKARPSRAACEAAMSPAAARRIRRAADLWLAGHAQDRECDIGFDAIFVVSGRLPRHIENGL